MITGTQIRAFLDRNADDRFALSREDGELVALKSGETLFVADTPDIANPQEMLRSVHHAEYLLRVMVPAGAEFRAVQTWPSEQICADVIITPRLTLSAKVVTVGDIDELCQRAGRLQSEESPSGEKGQLLRIAEAAAWYRDPEFIEWLNAPGTATWHHAGTDAGEHSDVFLHVCGTDGSDTPGYLMPAPPQWIWDEIVRLAEEQFGTGAECLVWISNIERDQS